MKITPKFLSLMAVVSCLCACAPQSTPSMMNTSLPRLSDETALLQIPAENVSEGYLYKISSDYERFGQGEMQLTLVYDPSSKTYTKMDAFKDMASHKETLARLGVRNLKGEVLEASNIAPTFMIAYDSVKALGPDGCRNMPGFDDGLTTREIGQYRFGCTTDTMLARQIYRPSDLRGVGDADPADGRRSVNNAEYYRRVTADEAEGELNVYSRDNIAE